MASLAEPPTPQPDPIKAIPKPRTTRSRFFPPTTRDDWLRLAEWAVGDWAATLRNAFLLLLVFAAMITLIGIAFGVESAAAATAVGLIVFLAGRRRDGSISD